VIAERGHRGASLAAVAERDQWDAVPNTRWRVDLLVSLVEHNAIGPPSSRPSPALLGEES